jgi:hypothetical protein
MITREVAGFASGADDIQNSRFNCLPPLLGRVKTMHDYSLLTVKGCKDAKDVTHIQDKASAGKLMSFVSTDKLLLNYESWKVRIATQTGTKESNAANAELK